MLWNLAAGISLALLTQCRSHAQTPLSSDLRAVVDRLSTDFGYRSADPCLVVSVTQQRLFLVQADRVVADYPVSTSCFGTGAQAGSNQTPLGVHRVAAKFGEGQPAGMVFEARRPTGEVAKIYSDSTDVDEDLVTSRVLWLEGLEPGVNQGGSVDSRARYIYIHGTNEEGLIGRPASHGCVRMKNPDVIDLFGRVPVGSLVVIIP